MTDKPRILYSSDGSHKLNCEKCSSNPCRCPKSKNLNPSEHTLKVRRETNGRGGKTVTVVLELPDNESYFKELTSKLKTHCGCGGAFKGQTIEIQGDHRDKVKAYLEARGFKVKLAGG
ncbi:MAG: translation initiation factor [Bacteriovoracaceae bacterium]|nr:translation initiation factor [Bacteriovoracaceae bacterium]